MEALNRAHRAIIEPERSSVLTLGRPSSPSTITAGALNPPIKSEFQQAFSAMLQNQIDSSPISSTLNATLGQQSSTSQDSAANPGETVTPQNALALQYGLAGLVPPDTISTNPASTSVSTPADAGATTETADDAYWAAQPPAVQELRNITDETERQNVAAQLASEGYTIDGPIMVWGWDPAITMQMRQSDGYTWVPSLMQDNVTAAPGLSGGGIVAYNPNSPPAGSIPVAVPSAS